MVNKKYIATGSVVAAFFLLFFLFAEPYKASAPSSVPLKTAEQIDREDLVKKIQSGSVLWLEYDAQVDVHLRQAQENEEKRERVQKYVSGYRVVLCQKYSFLLSASGTLEHADTCAAPTKSQPDFQ